MNLRILYEDDTEKHLNVCYAVYLPEQKQLVYILKGEGEWIYHYHKDITCIQIDNYDEVIE